MGWLARWRRKSPPKPVVNPISMYMLARELVGLTSSARAEVRLLRTLHEKNIEVIKMAIEELSRNVDQLIQLAESNKASLDAAVAAVASKDADEPAIVSLNSKVVAAVQALGGGGNASVTGTRLADVADPNAPA